MAWQVKPQTRIQASHIAAPILAAQPSIQLLANEPGVAVEHGSSTWETQMELKALDSGHLKGEALHLFL